MTEKRKKFLLASFIFTLLIFSGIFLWNKLSGPYLYAMPSLFQIVENWAPVIKQGTEGNFDFITKFDYDGDWYGSNNWNSFDRNSGNLHAYVYYAIIESNNYYFITYMFFHPKDVGNPFCGFCSSHENDSEGCRMVIYKDGTPYGKLELLETIAHHDKYTYRPGADIPIYSSHPAVYIVPYKHAVYGTNYAKSGWDRTYLEGGTAFPSKDGGGTEYYYGGYAELPQSHTGINFCSYNLINMESTIWANRLRHAYTYGECDFFTSSFWEGHFYFDPDLGLYRWRCFQIRRPKFGSRFYGNDYSSKWAWLPFVGSDIEAGPNAASAPWNYDFDSYGVGTWFIDPYSWHYGMEMSTCTLLNGESYIYNPYRYSSSCCTDGAINGLNVKKSVSQHLIEAGESVTYTYEVTNAFIYPARNVKILDDQLGLIQSIDFLELNQTWTIQKIVTLNQTTTNQAIATCNYSDNGNEVVSYSSNKITVFIGEPPPDEPPPDEPPPLPAAYAIASKVLDPLNRTLSSSLSKHEKIVWYWNNKHSLSESEHSLANWLEGKTIGARIDSNGNLEIEVSYSNFPNVITSPDLDFLGESFDAVRINYLNLMDYTSEKEPEAGIGWVDEAMAEAIEQEDLKEKKDGYFRTFPLKFNEWREETFKMKGLKYWKGEVKIRGLLFTPAYNSITAQGKFLISSIELIKLKNTR